MKKEASIINTHPTYPVIVEKDPEGGFVVTNPSFEGCYSQGETLEEALENIKEATSLCIDELRGEENGENDAIPKDVGIHTVTL